MQTGKKIFFLSYCLKFVLLPVDDDSRDLLIHEDQNGGEESRCNGGRNGPPFITERIHNPAPVR